MNITALFATLEELPPIERQLGVEYWGIPPVACRAVTPNERIAELFSLDRPFTEIEAREWAELTGE